MFPLFFRHVVSGSKLSAEDVTDGPVDTLGGEKINLKKKEDGGIQGDFQLLDLIITELKRHMTC